MPFDALRSSTRATSTSAKTIALMADLTHCVAISTANFREFGVALTTSNKSFASSPSNVRKFPPPPPVVVVAVVGCCSVRFVLDGRRGGKPSNLGVDREHRFGMCFGCFFVLFIDFVSTFFFVFVAPTFFNGAFGDPLFFFFLVLLDLLPAIIVFPLQNFALARALPPVNLRSIATSRLSSCSIVSLFPRRNRSYARDEVSPLSSRLNQSV